MKKVWDELSCGKLVFWCRNQCLDSVGRYRVSLVVMEAGMCC